MRAKVRVDSDMVAIDSIRAHPSNPRRGDVAVIAESLTHHGQYRPIVVHKGTSHILAGNHTWRAAKSLGWKKIAVTWVDCTEQDAARILLADNRAADLATYDDGALAELLRSLPDLDGTGFDRYDLERLEGVFDRPISLSDEPTVGEPGGGTTLDKPQIRLGELQLQVDPDAFTAWKQTFAADRKRKEIIADLRGRLGLLPPATEPVNAPERHPDASQTVPIDSLVSYPHNARQGDIGAISESLRVLGQYRPIVVNEPTGEVLVGNHTWQAARALGWTEIAVTYVNVDEVQAAKIVAVDNRTSDLASYDDEILTQTLTSLASIEGTGFSPMDVDDLLHTVANGGKSRRPAPTSKITCVIGDWSWKNTRDDHGAWLTSLTPEIEDGSIHAWIAHTLDLPDNTWTKAEPE